MPTCCLMLNRGRINPIWYGLVPSSNFWLRDFRLYLSTSVWPDLVVALDLSTSVWPDLVVAHDGCLFISDHITDLTSWDGWRQFFYLVFTSIVYVFICSNWTFVIPSILASSEYAYSLCNWLLMQQPGHLPKVALRYWLILRI